MAIIPGSVRFTGFIAPTDSTDTYAVTDPTWGLGGLRRVSGTTERDLIATGRRESGMLVYSENDDNYYKLGSGLTNSDWSVFMTGGGSGNFLSLSGGTVTGVTEFTASIISNAFSGGTYYSGGTDLYDIFSAGTALQDLQSVMDQGFTASLSGDNVNITSTDGDLSAIIDYRASSGRISISGVDNSIFDASEFYVEPTLISMTLTQSGASYTKLEMDGTSIIFEDTINSRGVDYSANYHANYVDRTLVDKEYVDNSISSGFTAGDFVPITGTSTNISGVIEFDDDIAIQWNAGGESITYDSGAATIAVNAVNGTDFETGAILSAGTDLYSIFSTSNGDITRVSGGTNINTGGTANNPVINLDDDITLNSISATTMSAGTLYSGSTDVSSLFASSTITLEQVLVNGNDTGANNIDFDDDQGIIWNSGGESIVYDSGAATIAVNAVNGTDFETGAILSAGTDLYNIFLTSAAGAITGNTNETLRFDLSGNPVSSGILLNDTAGITATTYVTIGTRTGSTIGSNSITNGEANVASGTDSRAGGFATVASGNWSVANGYQTLASGFLTRAEGTLTTASTEYSTAIGYQTLASGWASNSYGYLTKATSTLATSIGWSSEANGDESFAGGYDSRADGTLSFAFGDQVSATTYASFAIGDDTLAGGANSFAGGFGTQAIESNAYAFGWNSIASGWGSTARGLSSEAFSQGSMAEGNGSRAGRIQGGGIPGTGRYSHAQNYFTWAYADESHAGGAGVFGGPYVYATGKASFNHSEVNDIAYASSGASAANSAILGGLNQVIDSGALRSVVLGGHGITATTADTVYVPALNIYSALTNDNVLTEVLVRDTDGTIKYRDASTLVGSGATGNFLPLSGGTVTGDTDFITNISASTINLTSTSEAQITMTPVNVAAPADDSMWFTTSGGTTFLNYRVAGDTKRVELS